MGRFPCALTAGFPFGTNATIRPKATTSKAVPMIAESSADLDEFMMLFVPSPDRPEPKNGLIDDVGCLGPDHSAA